MLKPGLVEVLARAFLTGDDSIDAIVERSAHALGHPWRWLRPLVRRYLKATADVANPRRDEAVTFLFTDKELQRAAIKHRRRLKIAHWLPESTPPMRPVPAAEAWNLSPIETIGDLANWLELSVSDLEWYANLRRVDPNANARLRHYYYRILQKDVTRVRVIEAPKNRLKAIQTKILTGILERIPPHEAAHGFRKGRSIQSFCTPHVDRTIVVRMDMRDFFPSISVARIRSLFRIMGYPETVANLLASLCTNSTPRDVWRPSIPDAEIWKAKSLYTRRHLPQGAPTSPALANLCAFRLDCRLRGFAVAAGASYTRYADDLAFSGDEEFAKCAERFAVKAAAIVAEEGFEVHHRKTRIMRKSVRQHVAGLVVNKRLNVRRTDFDELKAILTNCVRLGPASQNRDQHADFHAHLQGRVAFVTAIHKAKGRKLQALLDQINWE